jgi:hypothetical protein
MSTFMDMVWSIFGQAWQGATVNSLSVNELHRVP